MCVQLILILILNSSTSKAFTFIFNVMCLNNQDDNATVLSNYMKDVI